MIHTPLIKFGTNIYPIIAEDDIILGYKTVLDNSQIEPAVILSQLNIIPSTGQISVSGFNSFLIPKSELDTHTLFIGSFHNLNSTSSLDVLSGLIENNEFSIVLWKKLEKLLNKNLFESALIEVYCSLKNEIVKSIFNCDNFIAYIQTVDENKLNSDLILHILNALSVVKDRLENWNNFYVFSEQYLKSHLDSEMVQILLDAVV